MQMAKLKSFGHKMLRFGIVFFLLLGAGHVLAQSDPAVSGCGGKEIVIADLQWPSASILAHVHQQVIEQNLDCKTSVAKTDIESVATTLKAAQNPTLIPEMWVTRVSDRWNQVLEARAGFATGDSFDQSTFEGWFLPPKVVRDFPALNQVANLKDIKEFYKLEKKPQFISCPADWACAVLNENMLKAYGLFASFDIVVPKDRLDMDQRIGAAISTNSPTVFYYWQPNALVDVLKLAQIELAPHSGEAFACMGKVQCKDLRPTGFAREEVSIIVADWVRADAPELLPYVRKAQMPVAVMNELLSAQVERQLTPAQAAALFVADYPQIWQAWLPVVVQ